MLLTLNEDCLHEIFNYLDFQDHLILADVSQELRDFTVNRLKSSGFDLNYWRESNAHRPLPKHLKLLMANSQGEIECKGDFLYANKIYLQCLQFSGITNLNLTACNFKTIRADELEHLIIELFPQVNVLKMTGSFRASFIWSLKNLETLEIDTPAFDEDSILNLKFVSLKKLSLKQPLKHWHVIKELTKLYELRELKMCANDYTQFALNSGFKLLKNLDRLTLSATTATEDLNVFFKDSDYYRKIDGIRFNMRLDTKHKTEQCFLSDMSKLRSIYFNNDDGSTLSAFCKTDTKSWHTIEEIYYINAENTTNTRKQQEDLLNLIKYTKNLKMLDITNSPFGDEFLKRVSVLFHAQLRNKQLLVRCHKTQITKRTQRSFLPKQLMLCHEAFEHENLPTSNSIEISFKEKHTIEDAIHYLGELLEIISRICDVKYLWDVLHEKKQKLQRIRNEEFILDSIKDISEERLSMWRDLLLDVRENMYRQVEIITEMVLSYTFLN